MSRPIRRTDWIFLFGLIALCCQGFLNSVLGETALAPWKQALIVFLLLLSFFPTLQKIKNLVVLEQLAAFATFLLIGNSLLRGQDFQSAFYSIFFYVAWIPFYSFSRQEFAFQNGSSFANILLAIVIVSAIGIMLQLKLGWFGFLNPNSEEYMIFTAQAGIAVRLAFVYNTSTTVLPTLVGFHYLICIWLSDYKKLVSFFCLAISLIPTGSLANAIVLLFAALMTVSASSKRTLSVNLILAGAVAVALVVYFDDQLWLQIDRIISNDTDSESSIGRLGLWKSAIDQIASFDLLQHVLGQGIGSTYQRTIVDVAQVNHGESSFFQAYLEGGILGLALRILPFYLLLRNFFITGRWLDLFYFISLFIACAVAPIFGTYGVQCLLGLAAGLRRAEVDQ